MSVVIPYLYKKRHPKFDYLTLDDFNQGITLCRKLGWEVSRIILGDEEYKQLENFSPKVDVNNFFNLNIKIIKGIKEKSEMTFICDKEYEG